MRTWTPRERFLATLAGEATDRPPVWMMRQAGRTLPEYRAVRAEHDFLTVMRTPSLAVEVTLQPVRRWGVDGAVVFSDILIVPEAMGQTFTMKKGDGPDLQPPLEDGPALRRPDPEQAWGWLGETLSTLRGILGDEAAVLGFAGAPFTLLCYMTQRLGKEASNGAKRHLAQHGPAILDTVADVVIDLLRYQIASGADAVQLFDTWAGDLSPDDYRRWVAPVNARIVAAIKPLAPVLLYLKNGAHLMEQALDAEPSGHAVDWRVDLPAFARRLDATGRGQTAIQGNLDPAALLGPGDGIRRQVRALHEGLQGRPGHIFNLGHGLLPHTPLDGIEAFVREVQAL